MDSSWRVKLARTSIKCINCLRYTRNAILDLMRGVLLFVNLKNDRKLKAI